jgi:acetyl-CoA carboxylase beta subunit
MYCNYFLRLRVWHSSWNNANYLAEPEAKKARLECEKPEEDSASEPLVVGTIHVHSPSNGKMVLDMAYESGSMGKSAVVELSQFFKNRLNVNHSNEKCKNAR